VIEPSARFSKTLASKGEKRMFKKIVSGICLALLLMCMLTSTVNLAILETSVVASTNYPSLASSEPPSTVWSKTYGGSADDKAYTVLQTGDGGYLVVGSTGSYGAGGLDMWLVKTDVSGDLQWSKTRGGSNDDVAYSAIQTSDGGYALAGYTKSFGAGMEDFCLVKTNSAGDLTWVRWWGGGSTDIAHCVVQTWDGGYAMVGYTDSIGASRDFCLVKYDSDGNFLWYKTYDHLSSLHRDAAYSIVQTARDGGYAMAGQTVLGTSDEPYGWFVKTDSAGNIEYSADGISGDCVYSLVQTSDRGYTGYTIAGASNGDFWLARPPHAPGEWGEWYRTYGGAGTDEGYCIRQLSDGGYVAAGQTASYGDGSDDFWVIRTDSLGNMVWNKTGGYAATVDRARSVVRTSDGGYAIAGYTNYVSGAGGYDFVLVKYGTEIPPTYALTITATAGGTTSPAPGTHTYSAGTTVDVTALPDEYYVLDHWELDGSDAGAANPIGVAMGANHTLHAVFSIITYALTITATAGGTTSPAPGGYTYSGGTVVNITALPDEYYVFDHWELDGSGVGGANPISVTMDMNHSLHAVFSVDWWPMFHHDLGHTGYSTSKAPNTNNVLWSYSTGDSIDSSPSLIDGKVYVGSEDNKLYCLNATTGTHIWNYTTGGGVCSSPGIADGRVYIGSRDGRVYCLDATTGTHIWNYTTGGAVGRDPTVAYGAVYIFSGDFTLYCLNATTGTHIWNYTTGPGEGSSPPPAVVDGKVYIGSYAKAWCLNATTGKHIWNYTTNCGAVSSPAVVNNKVYVGSCDRNIYCLDATTGTHIWNYTTGGGVVSSPAFADGKIYIGSTDQKVYCLNATTGTFIWSYTTGYDVESSPAVADDKVYINTNWKVYSLNATTGTIIWDYTHTYAGSSSPAVAAGIVIVGSSGGEVYAFGPRGQNLIIDDILVDNKGCSVYANDTYASETAYYVPVNITVANIGDLDAGSFNVSLAVYWMNGSLQEDRVEWRVSGLNFGDSTTLTYSWHPMHTGNYNLTAVVDCHGKIAESNETDNTLVVLDYPVALMGDVYVDHVNNLLDIVQVGLAWHSHPDDGNWNLRADLNHDAYIDIYDIVRVTLHWHQNW
jgi:outer membrane protein assembly factor BamB